MPVFVGRGLVAKIGTEQVVGREARVLGGLDGVLPLRVPRLVVRGAGWVVMEELAGDANVWDERLFAMLLPELDRLHDAFEASPQLREKLSQLR